MHHAIEIYVHNLTECLYVVSHFSELLKATHMHDLPGSRAIDR
jgi:hypothetical protein